MNANKPASAGTLKSDLKRIDAHKVMPGEYKDLPELTDAMLTAIAFPWLGVELESDLAATALHPDQATLCSRQFQLQSWPNSDNVETSRSLTSSPLLSVRVKTRATVRA